ncbi:hypothetical protein Tco_0837750 [Tanacetum coccineum]
MRIKRMACARKSKNKHMRNKLIKNIQAGVHQDELCPPNKCYALIDANKKIDLDNPLCPNESKILANILQNHLLGFSIVASSLVPWIYLGKFWHTLKEDGSKYRLSFVLDKKELTMTLNDFRTIFQLPQATDNNHEYFVTSPKKNKARVGMKIPSWIITDEMKLTEHYQIYAATFGVDVPTTQSQLIESTLGTHRITSSPRTPNPDVAEGESILTADEADDIILQDTIQLSIAEQKSHDELEAKQNVEKVKEYLAVEEIEKMVEGTKNVDSTLDSQNVPDTRIEPKSNKESLEVEKIVEVPINVIEEEEDSAEDDYELRRREKGKNVEESRNTPSPTKNRSPRTHSTRISLNTEKLQELTIFFDELQDVMVEALPKMVDDHVKELTKTQVLIYVAEGLIMERKQNQADMEKMIADAIQQDHENLHVEISLQTNNAITNHIPS